MSPLRGVTTPVEEAEERGSSPGRRRIRPEAALALLETMRSQDLPAEVLQDENVTLTLPRRLGLSDVIDAQIRRYREEVRRRQRITDGEFRDLVRLVIRRPDSEDIFLQVGESLSESSGLSRGWRRLLPRRVAFSLGARRVRARLHQLFGRSPGRLLPGRFVLQTQKSLLVACDPGGDACAIVSGLAGAILSHTTGLRIAVVEHECEGKGGSVCRWVAVELDAPLEAARGDGRVPATSATEVEGSS